MRLELVGAVHKAVQHTLILSRPTDSHGTRSPLLDMYRSGGARQKVQLKVLF